ncbi:MAG: ABC transporter permease [Solirubrobacteraceae bacterium]
MSLTSDPPATAAEVTPDPERGVDAPASRERGGTWRRHLGFRNIGAVYVWIVIVVLFTVWAPDTFPTWQTAKTVLNQNAIAGLVALALVVPLSARVFDLSVGSAMGLCNVIIAWLLVQQGVPMVPAILLTVLAGILLGLVNAIAVVIGRIDSFIATLATGSLMAAATTFVSDDQAIIGDELGGNFGKIATTDLGGITLPVFLMLIVATGLWFLLDRTATGRRIYATGFNEEGARLTGIRTARLRFTALVVSGTVAGVGAVLLTSQVSSGSPDIGSPYLLDAFAAAFLGATQFGGRFNAWGTVVAVLLLGTGKTGLVLVGAPVWASSMFAGLVLLFALGLTNFDRRLSWPAWARRRRPSGSAA